MYNQYITYLYNSRIIRLGLIKISEVSKLAFKPPDDGMKDNI